MNEYLIKSYHTVSEDSYNDGELDYVNGYELSYFIKATDPSNAIQQYIERKLYYKFNPKFIDTSSDDISVYYNVLVDIDNAEATESEYELWKQGKLKLYNDCIRLEVYNVSIVTNNEIQYEHD
jgi:hypothetical protein